MNFANANAREWRAAEIPAANGHGNARSIARLYGALARGGELDGVRVLSPQAIARATEVQATGPDAVMGLPLHMALGWVVSSPEAPLGLNTRLWARRRRRRAGLRGPRCKGRLRLCDEQDDPDGQPHGPALALAHRRRLQLNVIQVAYLRVPWEA